MKAALQWIEVIEDSPKLNKVMELITVAHSEVHVDIRKQTALLTGV